MNSNLSATTPSPTRTRRVTVREAAKILGRSESTIRRSVEDGRLLGARTKRPQGSVYRVELPADLVDAILGCEADPETSPYTRNAETATRAVVIPLVGTIRELQIQLARQAEMIGGLTAEVERLKGFQSRQEEILGLLLRQS
jgi:excisionase family DNA binding protein